MLRPRCRTLRALSCSDPNWPTQRLTLQIGRAQWRGGEFAADDEVRLQYIDDTLHFERLHEFGADLGVVEQLLADALDGLAHRLYVRGGLEVKVELHQRPAGFDILPAPKRVLHQKEYARDLIAHQALRAKADRDAADTEPGEERAD